jgi:hypothetical protein
VKLWKDTKAVEFETVSQSSAAHIVSRSLLIQLVGLFCCVIRSLLIMFENVSQSPVSRHNFTQLLEFQSIPIHSAPPRQLLTIKEEEVVEKVDMRVLRRSQ